MKAKVNGEVPSITSNNRPDPAKKSLLPAINHRTPKGTAKLPAKGAG